MFRCLCKKVFQTRRNSGDSTTQLCFLRSPSLRYISSSTNQHSITVSYLINSCGFSEQNAISASKQLRLESLRRPDSVLTLFRNHGFTKTQISKIIAKRPLLLGADPDKILGPKIEFLRSIGFSGTDLANLLCKDPTFLTRSLKNQIIPSIDFLRSIVHTDKNVVATIKRTTRVLLRDPQKQLAPNIAVLRDHGVPEANISKLLATQPSALMKNADRFNEIVKEINEMGIDPLKSTFVLAVHGLTSLSKSTWEAKMEVYRRWGWSEDEIRMAFIRQPFCMMASEKKIMGIMDFLVNKMGYEPSLIAKRPAVLLLSLEKRIIPRCSVIQVLLSKGLIEKKLHIPTVLTMLEEYFLKKFVTKYQESVSELSKVYQGKKNCQALPNRSEDMDGVNML